MKNSILESYISRLDHYVKENTGSYNSKALLLKDKLLAVKSLDKLQEKLNHFKLSNSVLWSSLPLDPLVTLFNKMDAEVASLKETLASCNKIGARDDVCLWEHETAHHLIALINETLSNQQAQLHIDFSSFIHQITNESQLYELIELMISLPDEGFQNRERSGSFFEKLELCPNLMVISCNKLLQRVSHALALTNHTTTQPSDDEQTLTAIQERTEKLGKCNLLLQKLLRIYIDTQPPNPSDEKRDSCVLL